MGDFISMAYFIRVDFVDEHGTNRYGFFRTDKLSEMVDFMNHGYKIVNVRFADSY